MNHPALRKMSRSLHRQPKRSRTSMLSLRSLSSRRKASIHKTNPLLRMLLCGHSSSLASNFWPPFWCKSRSSKKCRCSTVCNITKWKSSFRPNCKLQVQLWTRWTSSQGLLFLLIPCLLWSKRENLKLSQRNLMPGVLRAEEATRVSRRSSRSRRRS